MPDWALRVAAVVVTGLSMAGSTSYALAHPKNPNAPLRPPVADRPAPVEVEPEGTAAPVPFRTLAPTAPATPSPSPTKGAAATVARASVAPTLAPTPTRVATLRPTPIPQVTLSAAVRATALPRVTYTHSS